MRNWELILFVKDFVYFSLITAFYGVMVATLYVVLFHSIYDTRSQRVCAPYTVLSISRAEGNIYVLCANKQVKVIKEMR